MSAYRHEILAMLDTMSKLSEAVRPANKSKIGRYLDTTYGLVQSLVDGFQGTAEWPSLLPRFQSYMDLEEVRIRKSLETFKYKVDALDTLALINGRKGLERVSWSLIFDALDRGR